MTIFSSSFALGLTLLAIFLLHATCLQDEYSRIGKDREALEIIIGGGGGSSSSPPPPEYQDPPPCSPPPPAFASKRIELVYPVIQKFKQKVKYDPHGITKTWVGPDICNKYKGFFCDTLLDFNETALAGVNFNGFKFGGAALSLDGFVDQLPDITVFHANSNGFSGAFPSKISQIKYLYELDLSNNKYTCGFPYEVLVSNKLTFLDLRFNSFSGLVPPQLFTQDVDVLFINNNNFMQKIPDNLGSSPALYLTLANNNFNGPIPKSLGQAGKTLKEILLLNNSLSGCLPCEIGLLNRATVFDASHNLLTGPIPQSFACLGRMEILNLGNNQLYGPVPEPVCKLPNLENLTLSYNYLTKIGPECWKLVKKNKVDVRMNCIPGWPGQRSAAECEAFLSMGKSCSDERSLNWVPCSPRSPSRRKTLDSTLELRRSYDALNPHK
ncbi:Leucine-rich repeat family protein [Perilla frutescens var. hirtella]|uniref:Leucine-rich repeat family protein n=1 Tax=Perilla frutescens var. hirtella TaxID=608512 RepID=A0AAD4J2K1_PERFH|nr:Leucine-rich repeat family protein [Perilla frutescens var. hirtella]